MNSRARPALGEVPKLAVESCVLNGGLMASAGLGPPATACPMPLVYNRDRREDMESTPMPTRMIFPVCRPATVLLLSALVVACGGGGGGDSAPANVVPTVAALEDRMLEVGEEVTIPVSVTDANAADTHTITALSSDADIARVAVSGTSLVLTGVAVGTATITLRARDNSGAANAVSQPVTFDVEVEAAGGWVEGVFEPAAMFKDLCANPRQQDPVTGTVYADMPGATLDENNWLRSWSNDTYLWYDEIVDRDPAQYSNPIIYFGLLKTTARTPSGNPKDQFHFTWPTDEWEAFVDSGAMVGYGMQVVLLRQNRPREAVVAYTEPDSSAHRAGLARGARILRVDGVDLAEGTDADTLNNGLFPVRAGEEHEFEVLDLGGTEPRTVRLTSMLVESDPVQHVTVLKTDSGPVGYMLFNDFISTAERELFDAFETLSNQGITDLVLDLRYNGGGLLAIAGQLGFMIAGPAAARGRVFEELQFNDKHPDFDPVTGERLRPVLFADTSAGFSVSEGEPLPSVNLSRVFVLSGPNTCSASESVINGLRGIDVEVVLIGDTTCGKPYGFYGADNCGTTYFTVQFKGLNAKGFGEYADGFSPANIDNSAGVEVPGCAVADDFDHDFGDPAERRLRAALQYRRDGTCPLPISLAIRSREYIVDRKPWTPEPLLKTKRGLKVLRP